MNTAFNLILLVTVTIGFVLTAILLKITKD